jgi:hypothetical protein
MNRWGGIQSQHFRVQSPVILSLWGWGVTLPSMWMCSPTWKFSNVLCASEISMESWQLSLQLLSHSQRLKGRAESSNLLIIAWSFWWLAPIQEPTKNHLIRKKTLTIQRLSRVLGALCQELVPKTKYIFLLCHIIICKCNKIGSKEIPAYCRLEEKTFKLFVKYFVFARIHFATTNLYNLLSQWVLPKQ